MRAPLLVSYATATNSLYADTFGTPSTSPLLFLDSGAFTAFQMGWEVDVHDYGQWLQAWGPLVFAYANLDVIFDPAASAQNLRILEDEYGLHPVPVFHAGSAWEHFDRIVEAGHRYVALGGMVPHTGRRPDALRNWIRTALARAPEVRFHGFGLGMRLARDLPLYSSDTTIWTNAWRFGRPCLFDRARDHAVHSIGIREIHRYGRLMRRWGVDPDLVQIGYGTIDSPYRRSVYRMTLLSVAGWAAYLADRVGTIPAPEGFDGPDGPLVFIAGVDHGTLPLVVEAGAQIGEEVLV